MENCADFACNCGDHECIFKNQRNAIQPVVYRGATKRNSRQQEENNKHFAQTDQINTRGIFQQTNSVREHKSCLRHPSHTYTKYQHCPGNHLCGDVGQELESCGHGHYVPKSTPYQGQTCHPDRPEVVDVKEIVEPESKECEKCKDIFSNLKSLWDKHSPPRRKEDLLNECRDFSDCHCDHDVFLECCCRCCTCRGCPSCRRIYSHPCDYLSLAKDQDQKRAAVKIQIPDDVDVVCPRHPSGCYFVPKRNK